MEQLIAYGAAAFLIASFLLLWGTIGWAIQACFGLLDMHGWFDNWFKPRWVYKRTKVNKVGLAVLMMLFWTTAFPLLLIYFIKFIFTVGRKD